MMHSGFPPMLSVLGCLLNFPQNLIHTQSKHIIKLSSVLHRTKQTRQVERKFHLTTGITSATDAGPTYFKTSMNDTTI